MYCCKTTDRTLLFIFYSSLRNLLFVIWFVVRIVTHNLIIIMMTKYSYSFWWFLNWYKSRPKHSIVTLLTYHPPSLSKFLLLVLNILLWSCLKCDKNYFFFFNNVYGKLEDICVNFNAEMALQGFTASILFYRYIGILLIFIHVICLLPLEQLFIS